MVKYDDLVVEKTFFQVFLSDFSQFELEFFLQKHIIFYTLRVFLIEIKLC